MNRSILYFATASMFLMGCGRVAFQPASPSSASRPAAKTTAATRAIAIAEAPASRSEQTTEAVASAASTGRRQPGDFVVQRFSGSYLRTPLVLTQRVLAREGATIVVEVTADRGRDKRTMRVRLNDAGGTEKELVGAAWLLDGAEKAAPPAAYDKLLASTVLAVDRNEATLARQAVDITVSGVSLRALRTSYRVRVGGQLATMNTLESEGFSWGDLGGEIVTSNGEVLYKAELVELGHAPEKAQGKEAVVAQAAIGH
jgi:hypothetical protein